VVLNLFWLAAHFSSEIFFGTPKTKKIMKITSKNFCFCIYLLGFENCHETKMNNSRQKWVKVTGENIWRHTQKNIKLYSKFSNIFSLFELDLSKFWHFWSTTWFLRIGKILNWNNNILPKKIIFEIIFGVNTVNVTRVYVYYLKQCFSTGVPGVSSRCAAKYFPLWL